jgi:crotonobetainyl-CoA:carnitine CoA-transferase CaiB-like acyl-CoA transferase
LATGYFADKVAGLLATQAALAAVHARESTHLGSTVDVAMLDALAYFNGPDLFAGSMIKDDPQPEFMRHVGGPRPLKTKDGWIIISPVSGRQLKSLMTAVDHPEWGDQLRAAPDSPTLMSEMHRLLDFVMPTKTTAEWERIVSDADVPVSAALTLEEHFHDPQVIHSHLYHDMDDPTFGKIRRLRYPALFDALPVDTDDLPVPPLPEPA